MYLNSVYDFDDARKALEQAKKQSEDAQVQVKSAIAGAGTRTYINGYLDDIDYYATAITTLDFAMWLYDGVKLPDDAKGSEVWYYEQLKGNFGICWLLAINETMSSLNIGDSAGKIKAISEMKTRYDVRWNSYNFSKLAKIEMDKYDMEEKERREIRNQQRADHKAKYGSELNKAGKKVSWQGVKAVLRKAGMDSNDTVELDKGVVERISFSQTDNPRRVMLTLENRVNGEVSDAATADAAAARIAAALEDTYKLMVVKVVNHGYANTRIIEVTGWNL